MARDNKQRHFFKYSAGKRRASRPQTTHTQAAAKAKPTQLQLQLASSPCLYAAHSSQCPHVRMYVCMFACLIKQMNRLAYRCRARERRWAPRQPTEGPPRAPDETAATPQAAAAEAATVATRAESRKGGKETSHEKGSKRQAEYIHCIYICSC